MPCGVAKIFKTIKKKTIKKLSLLKHLVSMTTAPREQPDKPNGCVEVN